MKIVITSVFFVSVKRSLIVSTKATKPAKSVKITSPTPSIRRVLKREGRTNSLEALS